ncbi:MAG: ATP-binding protein [Bacteroidota bacterium]
MKVIHTMKHCVYLLLLIGGVHLACDLNATNPRARIDSLNSIIKLSSDTGLVEVYNKLSWNYRNIDADTSFHFARRGYELAKKIDYLRGESESLNYMGIAMRNKGDFSDAMTAFFDALQLAETSEDHIQINYTLINIGNIYLSQENYNGALQYFERVLKNSSVMTDSHIASYSHINMGRAYMGMRDYDKAEKHLLKSINLRQKINDLEGTVIAKVSLADMYLAQGKPSLALKILTDNMDDLEQMDDKNTIAYCEIDVAKIYNSDGKHELALRHIDKAITICRQHKLRNTEIQALKVLASIYEAQDLHKDALDVYKQYLEKRDSIFNEENTEKIAKAFSEYTLEKSELEKTSLMKKYVVDEAIIKRQRMTIALSVISTALFFIIAVLSIRSAAIRKKLNHQIQAQKEAAFQQNNELIDLNSEKNNLIRILSHDLRAPINNIKGLTQVHQLDHANEFTDSENETLNMIKSESDRLLNMITKILNVEALNDDKQEIKFEKVEIRAILRDLLKSFKTSAETKGIEIVAKYTEEPLYMLGDEVHVRQIAENLLSNAIKFTKQDSQVKVCLGTKRNSVQISVKDQGPGLTKEDEKKIFKKFQTLSAKPTGNEDSTGLGLSIVKRYTEEMNGKIWYKSSVGKGTTFFVEFDKAEATNTSIGDPNKVY